MKRGALGRSLVVVLALLPATGTPVPVSGTLQCVWGQVGLCALDWNGDGTVDLICGNEYDGHIYVRLGVEGKPLKFGPAVPLRDEAGDLITGERTGWGTRDAVAAAADWDSDGLLDLLVAHRGSGHFEFFRNVGTPKAALLRGGMAPPLKVLPSRAPAAVWGISAVDWNGDGAPDLLVGCTNRIIVALNTPGRSTPVFSQWETLCTADGAVCKFPVGDLVPVIGDINGDGLGDLVVGVEYRLNQSSICLSQGMRSFVYIYINDGAPGKPSFGLGKQLTLADSAPFDAAGNLPSPLLLDWSGDGLADLIVSTTEAPPILLQNVGTSSSPAFTGPNFYDTGPTRVGDQYGCE